MIFQYFCKIFVTRSEGPLLSLFLGSLSVFSPFPSLFSNSLFLGSLSAFSSFPRLFTQFFLCMCGKGSFQHFLLFPDCLLNVSFSFFLGGKVVISIFSFSHIVL